MRLVADGVFQLRGFPPNVINVYLVEDVLVDAGYPLDARRILRQLEHREVNSHALTHAHPDHVGASAKVTRSLGNIPIACGAEDVEAAERGKPPHAPHQRLGERLPGVPPVNVARALHEGDEVAGFRVLDVPGHSPGHVAYWREADGTLIVGDVFFNLHPLTGIPMLREPPRILTYDPQLNRESMRKLAELEPRLTLFGHGPPLRGPRKLADFVAALPS